MLSHQRYIGKKGMLPKLIRKLERTAKKTDPSTAPQKVISKGSPPTYHP